MFNKRIMFILILLIVAIGTISCASANDINGTQEMAVDDNIEVTQTNDLVTIDDSADVSDVLSDGEVNAKITPINLEGAYKVGKATLKLTDLNDTPLADKKVTLTIIGSGNYKSSRYTDAEGIATFNFNDLKYVEQKITPQGIDITQHDLKAGTWNITLGVEDSVVVADTVRDTLTVYKVNATINIDEFTSGQGVDKNLTISLVDSVTGTPIAGEYLILEMKKFMGNDEYALLTDSKGEANINVKNLPMGTYWVSVDVYNNESIQASQASGKFTITQMPAFIKASKLTTTYNSGKTYNARLVDSNDLPISGVKLKLKIYTGSSSKTVTAITDDNGTASFDISGLSGGTHKVEVINTATDIITAEKVTSSIVVKAKELKFFKKAYKNKKAGGVQIGVYEKSSKNLMKGIKIQLKVYTGSKYKTFNLVTGYYKAVKKNVVVLESNRFSVGTHKVVVTIKSPNYKGSTTCKLTIPKTAKNYSKYTMTVSNGKVKIV